MMPTHAVLWLDDHEAQLIHFDARGDERRHLVRDAGPDAAWFDRLAAEVADAEEILVIGAGTAPQRFARWVARVSPAQRARIFDIEIAPRSDDHALLARARRYFARVDRLPDDETLAA